MTQEDKELLLTDLCARVPYHPQCYCKLLEKAPNGTNVYVQELSTFVIDEIEIMDDPQFKCQICDVKPYLRPMSSMTEEEAKEIAILYGLKDILSIKITDEYIDVAVDDGVCSTERWTIWYDEIISSIEIFDWLNRKHFDYRGLIPMGLALEAPEGMYEIVQTSI